MKYLPAGQSKKQVFLCVALLLITMHFVTSCTVNEPTYTTNSNNEIIDDGLVSTLTSTVDPTTTADINEVTDSYPAVDTEVEVTVTPHQNETMTPIIVSTLNSTPTITDNIYPIQIASIVPDARWRSSTPNNIWWSENSQTLYFQNESTKEAWEYSISSQTITSISYSPRTPDEVYTTLEEKIPRDAEIYSISPQQTLVLFTTPLPQIIELTPPRFDNERNPAFVAELWLIKEGQISSLGLVDFCFLAHQPQWSANESYAIVDTYFTPDVTRACLSNSWIVNLKDMKVQSLRPSWDEEQNYRGLDISNDGRHLLLLELGRNGSQYLYNVTSNELVAFPNSHGIGAFVENEANFVSLFSNLDIEGEISSDGEYSSPVSLSVLTSDSSELLATLDGRIRQWSISPDQQYAIFVTTDLEKYETKRSTHGIWLVAIPKTG